MDGERTRWMLVAMMADTIGRFLSFPPFDNSVCSLSFFPLFSSAGFSFGGDGWGARRRLVD